MAKMAPRASNCFNAAKNLGPEDTTRFLELHETYASLPPMDAARSAAEDLLREIHVEAKELAVLIAAGAPAAVAPSDPEKQAVQAPAPAPPTAPVPAVPPVAPETRAVAAPAEPDAAPVDAAVEPGATAEQGDEPNAATATESAAEPAAPSEDAPIRDVGEKIGGARKDLAVSTGAARKKASDDTRPAWARRFEVSQSVAGIDENGDNTGRWAIRDTKSLDWMKQPRQVGRDTYATKEEAEAFVPLAAVSLKHRVYRRDDKYEVWRDITDRKRVKVVERAFDSREEAMAYMMANAAQIVETNTTFGEADMPLPPDRSRTGAERRQGDVKGEDFMRSFGFRAVEFGNWNNQEERQSLMNDAWDGLLDLADVLGVPPKALGLNGDLALAFGARGHGLQSARAHYELERAVINLAKERGAGSLAHEWFHALDHYFGRQDGKASAKWETQPDGTRRLKAKGDGLDMASSGFQRNNSGVRPELRDAYDKLLTTLFKKAEGYVEDTAKADQFTGRAKEDMAGALDKLRAELSAQKDPSYYKRNNKPASAEMLAEFDTVAKAMLDGEATALSTEWRNIPGSKAAIALRWTNDNLERLSAIHKEVRGRSGFDGTNREGVFDRLRGYMDRYSQRLKMLADAQTGAEKTRMVPTDFAMNAKELDQGRGTDYWTTPHEMVARAFQGYVEDKIAERGGVSRFLNYGPENVAILTPWGAKRPFPAGAERKAINTALDGFVQALQTREDDAGNVAMFSRETAAQGRATPSDIARVTTTADAIRAAWANSPPVIVFGDMQDAVVPEAVRRRDAQQRSQGATGEPRAFYAGGTVYLHAGMLQTPMDVAEALFHEALGHAGLRGNFGPGLDRVLDLMAKMYKPEVMRAKAKEYGLDLSNLSERRQVAEEVLAEMAQTKPENQWVQRALAAIRTWLRENLPSIYGDMKLTDAEVIRSFILPARGFIERGAAETVTGVWPAQKADAKFSMANRKLMPRGAVATVSLSNGHRNLYGNYDNSGPVLLKNDGRVLIDGMLLSPGDVVYALDDGRFVKDIPAEVREYIAKTQAPYIRTLTKMSEKINRKVAKKWVEKPTPKWDEGSASIEEAMDQLFRNGSDGTTRLAWEAARYPEARPGWGSDIMVYNRIEEASEKHDPEALKNWVVQDTLDKHSKFVVGNFLHVDDAAREDGLSPEQTQAIRAWIDLGGRIGKSTGDAMSKSGEDVGDSPAAFSRTPDQTKTAAFRAWFGASVVTEGGKPGGKPLQWVYGDDEGNAQRLIALNLKAVENAFPDFAKVDFDAATGQFFNATTGKPIDRDRLVGRADELRGKEAPGGPLGSAHAAGRTVARAVVLRALSRQESGGAEGGGQGRNGVLDRLGAAAGGLAGRGLKGLFKRGTNGAGLTVDALQAMAAQMATAGISMPINVVQSVDGLPTRKRQEVLAQAPDGRVRGVYFRSDDQVWVVADNIRGADEFTFVVLHESFHRGLAKTIPDAKPVLREMWRTNQALRVATAQQMRRHKIGQDEAIEEALADMAGEGKARDLRGWDKLLATVRNWLTKVSRAIGSKMVWTDDMVADFVAGMTRQGLTVNAGVMPMGGGTEVLNSRAVDQTQTEAFRKWFGDSKVVDAQGKPLVVYHGTNSDFAKFDPEQSREDGTLFVTPSQKIASEFALYRTTWGGANVMPLYVKADKILTIEGRGRSIRAVESMPHHARLVEDMRYGEHVRQYARRAGYDGILFKDVTDDVGPDMPPAGDIYALFETAIVKSATGNSGTFNPADPDIRASRAGDAIDTARSALTARNVADKWDDLTRSSESFNWWHRTVGTQYHKAHAKRADGTLANPLFKAVYDRAQTYLHDTAAFANDPADLAPNLLPQLKTLGDMKKRLSLKKADADALATAVFDGTLQYARDDSGQLKQAGETDTAGVVFTDNELQTLFGFNAAQVGLYREFRRATDRSLDTLVTADVARLLGDGLPDSMRAMISTGDLGRFKGIVSAFTTQQRDSAQAALAEVRKRHRNKMAAYNRKQKAGLEGPRGRAGSRMALMQELDAERNALKLRQGGEKYRAEQEAKKWTELERSVREKYERIGQLKAQGYAPLMRFGRYTVDVIGADGSREFFGMFETEREANAAARKFRAAAEPGAAVNQGILSEEAYKQFSGLTPETIELFAEVAGVEKSAIFEEYLRRAKNNRSALKRLIKRTGVAGFSEDTSRVLASFITSNARAASASLHLGKLGEAVEAIPKEAGDVKDQAIKLREYVQIPQEEAQGIRTVLFAQFLGGSVASALVNMTQPLMMTLPYLSQWGGPVAAARRLAAAAKAALPGATHAPALAAALRQAEKEGIVEPQELHQLQAEASRNLGNNEHVRRMLFAWGGFFSLAERFNRRVSFIAAFETAVANSKPDPFAFASNAVDETQGVYNKGNRPNWARGAVGAVLFTFKQYSISYVEFLKRLPTKERALALGILLLAAGVQGMPGADDLDDIIDTLGQHLGYDTNAKLWKARALNEAVGKEAADFVLRGFSALPGIPLDVAGRLGLGNLIPGTGMLRKDKADKSSEVVEAIGPAGSLAVNLVKALPALLSGDLGKVNAVAGPVATKNLGKAIEMYLTGEYRDMAGRKVRDVTVGEAITKGIGFQPAEVARDSRRTQLANQQVALARAVEAEIAGQWAAGLADQKPDQVQKARHRLAEWNRDNPQSRIGINSAQIVRRVREIRSSRDDRFLKRAPKEMRAGMAEVMN